MSVIFIVGVGALAALMLVLASGIQSVPVTEQRRRVAAIVGLWPADTSIPFTATTASSTALSAVSSLSGLQVGMTVSGPGIPVGTTIVAITSAGGGALTLSAAATSSVTGVALTATWAAGTAQIHLFASSFTGGPDPAPLDFTEATFTGYEPQSITTGIGPYTTATGSAEIDFGDFGWVLTATPATTNTIFGYWVDYVPPGGGSTRVVACWETFATPQPMTEAGNAVSLSFPVVCPLPGSASIL